MPENGIPYHLRDTAPATQEDDLRTRLSGPDLREKLEENSEASSTSAIPAEHSSNWDVQVEAEEQSNNNTEDPPLLQVPVAFACKDQRFSKVIRGKDGSHDAKLWWMAVTEEVGTQSW